MMEPEVWTGCYEGNWNGLITPESFAHPAKFAKGLIERIFLHMLNTGMIERGGTVADPFGGIASGGVIAAGLGLQWFGCESVGFVCVKEVRAMLVKEQRHPDLFGGDDHVKTTAKKSFFRRLYEKRFPENSIDWEIVLFFRKPQ